MDNTYLKFVGLFCLLGLSGCVAHKMESASSASKTFFSCTLPPTTLLIMSEQFLEWQKGYAIKIRDHERGMTVTDWTMDTPSERHRVTVRTMVAPQGSLISTHTELQTLGNQDWRELPSNGSHEAQLLKELKEYLKNSPALKDQKVSVFEP